VVRWVRKAITNMVTKVRAFRAFSGFVTTN
jgi:hypothetical protein